MKNSKLEKKLKIKTGNNISKAYIAISNGPYPINLYDKSPLKINSHSSSFTNHFQHIKRTINFILPDKQRKFTVIVSNR